MRVALLIFISALIAIIAPVQGQNAATATNDINALNYALALEALESTYYTCRLADLVASNPDCAGRGYTPFTQADFVNAGYPASYYTAFVAIGQQELAHQTFLNTSIRAAGATPVPRCIYNFNALVNSTTVAQFIAFAVVLENTGVSAYAGALNAFTNPNLAQIAATIASVEARHAAWLNQITGVQIFNASGYDLALTPQQVATTVGPLLSSSSCVSTLPNIRPYGVAGTGATTFQPTGPLAAAAGSNYQGTQRANDIKTLQYALMLENLENAFYAAGQALYNQTAFAAAGFNATVYSYFNILAANEASHVAVLRNFISVYGSTPYGACTYNFSAALSNVTQYILTARTLENVGSSAYDGAANTLTDTNLQQAAATIAMIESRHAAYLNVITTGNNSNAFPTAFETAIPARTVVSNVVVPTQLITSCPFDFSLTSGFFPDVLPVNWGVPNGTSSSSGGFISSSSGRNGVTSTASVSMGMIVVAVIAVLAMML